MILGMAKLHLVIANVLKIGSMIKLKKLSIHDLGLNGWLNYGQTKLNWG